MGAKGKQLYNSMLGLQTSTGGGVSKASNLVFFGDGPIKVAHCPTPRKNKKQKQKQTLRYTSMTN
jgi:hypothetical protein